MPPTAQNPFSVTRAEGFNHSYDLLAALMHFKPGVADVLLSNDNVFIEGSRGSGKSMYLRLLSLPAKLKYEGLALQEVVQSLPSHRSFVGCYAKLTSTIFSPHEFESAPGYYDKFRQLFNVYCAEHMLSTLIDASRSGLLVFSSEGAAGLIKSFSGLFLTSTSEVSGIEDLANSLRKERRLIRQQLNTQPLTSDERSQPDVLWEAAEAVAATPDFHGQRVHLLVDEYDSLSDQEQRVINSYLHKRDFPLTFKIACKKHRLVLEDDAGNPLNQHGDFERVELDDDDFGRSGTFKRYLEAIANKRLQHAGLTSDVKTLLGSGPPPTGPKAERSYGGFDTFAALSSGIVRTFIELCRDAYARSNHDGGSPAKPISLTNQDQVVKAHASSKWNGLARDYSARLELQHLVEQIAALFTTKSESTKETQIIRLELVDFDRASSFLRSLLDQALEFEALVQPNRERLQKNRNAASRGYLLHRLLCVHFRLPIQSRWDIEVSSDQLEKLALGTYEDVATVAQEPTKQTRRIAEHNRPSDLLETWHCPILDQQCPQASSNANEGFLSCRLPPSGKIRDAIQMLKDEFARAHIEAREGLLRTAEDFAPEGDIACKVCAAMTQCRFTIVELSRFSPSVCMELGLAIARSIPTFVLFSKEEQSDVPDPFSSIEYFRYSITPASVRELVQEKIVPHLAEANRARRTIAIGPEEPPTVEMCDGVFVALPGAPYYQETVLPRVQELANELGLGPVYTEQEGQALQDLHRAATNIAKSRLAFVDTTLGAPTRAVYLGMAQGYRKPFVNLVDSSQNGDSPVFANARSKSELFYDDSNDLVAKLRARINSLGLTR